VLYMVGTWPARPALPLGGASHARIRVASAAMVRPAHGDHTKRAPLRLNSADPVRGTHARGDSDMEPCVARTIAPVSTGYGPLTRPLVSTTSRLEPVKTSSSWSTSSSKRGSLAPETYQGDPLSARIIP
jgi:hypothetical protein